MLLRAIRADLAIIKERDPAARGTLEILLCYPGLHALVLHRCSHRLWLLHLPLIPPPSKIPLLRSPPPRLKSLRLPKMLLSLPSLLQWPPLLPVRHLRKRRQ